MEANWFVDPLGRFQGRFFDGEQWTNQVSDDGVSSLDPDWPPRQAGQDSLPSWIEERYVDKERRSAGDQRQVSMRFEDERRWFDRRVAKEPPFEQASEQASEQDG